jgi:hypothetical protein
MMADPVTLAMVGAAAGAAMKPKNPLQGAMLGATAGFTGGTALGIGAAGGAAGGGLALGSGGATGLTAGTGAGLSAGTGAGLSAGGSTIGLGSGTAAGLSAVPATTAASTFGNYSLAANAPAAANYSLIAPSAVTSTPAPSFMESIGISGKNAFQNPMMTGQALNATNSLLQPDQQMATAPVVPVTARNKLANYDPMAALDPYRPSAIGNSQFSLI